MFTLVTWKTIAAIAAILTLSLIGLVEYQKSTPPKRTPRQAAAIRSMANVVPNNSTEIK